MKEIKLTKGYIALVDDDDYEWLNKLKWCSAVKTHTIYANRGRNETMHRVIMSPPEGKEVDHIDGNGLNNTRSNLRICTHKENSHNMRSFKNSSSKYVGVIWVKDRNKWRAIIDHDGKKRHIGYFENEDDAAIARDKEVLRCRSDFAKLNILKRKK